MGSPWPSHDAAAGPGDLLDLLYLRAVGMASALLLVFVHRRRCVAEFVEAFLGLVVFVLSAVAVIPLAGQIGRINRGDRRAE